jgi:hypothetical protein
MKNRKQRHVYWMMGLALALFAAIALAAIALTAPTLAAQDPQGGPPPGRGNRGNTEAGQGSYGTGAYGAVTGDLDADEQEALTEFLYDEYHALATYQAVMATFGDVNPFSAIARAEQQHIAALEAVFTRYGLALPAIPTFDIPAFDSVEDACTAAAQAEINNAALYDRLLSTIDNPDVVQVAENLRDASLNNHLPAFNACAEGETSDVPLGQGGPTWRTSESPTTGTGMRGRGGITTGANNGATSGTPGRGLNTNRPAYQQGTFRGR